MQENTDHSEVTNNEVEEYTEEMKTPPPDKMAKVIDVQKLNDQSKERAKKKPLLQKIVSAFKKEKKPFKELIINSEPLEKRVALLVDGVLEKFEVERTDQQSMVGAVFKGRIQNLEPGLKAAFVDIGQPKNAFLHYWDILPAANDSGVEIVRENKNEEQLKRDKITIKDIPDRYPIGTEIIVQITKGQIGSKGPRTTTNIALPGRFLVLMPHAGQCGISRKIEDKKERSRLKKIISKLTLPEGMGLIVRTAGEGKRIRYFIRDLHMLLQEWNKIMENIKNSDKPTIVYQEPGLLGLTVRDFLTEDIDRVLLDNKESYEEVQNTVAQISTRSRSKIVLFNENIPIFERFNIERQIQQTFMRKVPLPSGGEIVIEETEALVAIDVNTGGHKGASGDSKNFIVQANIEAAHEASRQIRLRNIGGLIIIDFIDMKNKKDRNTILRIMRDEMAKDKAKSHVLPISQLGILQMTRQRHQESNTSGMYDMCPYCYGSGSVKSARTTSVEIQRKLVSVCRHYRSKNKDSNKELYIKVLLHPVVLERLRKEDEQLLLETEELFNVKLSFRSDPNYHVENFKILDNETGREMV
jgi:ribonuclease G